MDSSCFWQKSAFRIQTSQTSKPKPQNLQLQHEAIFHKDASHFSHSTCMPPRRWFFSQSLWGLHEFKTMTGNQARWCAQPLRAINFPWSLPKRSTYIRYQWFAKVASTSTLVLIFTMKTQFSEKNFNYPALQSQNKKKHRTSKHEACFFIYFFHFVLSDVQSKYWVGISHQW